MVALEVSEMLILEAIGTSDGGIGAESSDIFSEMSFGSMVGSRASDNSETIAERGGEG